MTIINAKTFDNETVEVTFKGVTKRVKAMMIGGNRLVAFGFTGRYKTGAKAWPARVTLYIEDNQETIIFGRDERTNRCTKAMLTLE